MSDMFESLELNMREEADRVNPTKAIMASQLECEKRFEGFVAKNPERIDFIADDIRSVADKYAAQYDISSDTVYEATVSHLKEAAVKQANPRDPFAGKDEAHSDLINDYVGYNMDLDQIGLYWNEYKPLVQSALQGNWNQDQNQLEMELEHLKNELDGIDSEEEGSERYWALEEEISKALSALYDRGVDHSLDEAAQNTDIGEPMTSETPEFRMGSTQQNEASVKTSNIDWEDLGDRNYRANGSHGEWNIEPQSREDQSAMGLDEWDMDGEPRQDRYQLAHIPHGGNLSHDIRDTHASLPEAFEAARQYQSDWNNRDRKRSSVDKESFEWTDLINPVGLIKNIPDAAAATGNLIGDAVGAMGNSPVGQATKALVQPGAMLQGLVGQGPAADLGQAMMTSPAAELAKGLAGGAGNAKAGPFMSTSSVADQKLAAFLTAHQDVLFPELTKLGLTWQDMLQRSNLYGNKINPENLPGAKPVGQGGSKPRLLPSRRRKVDPSNGGYAADENPTIEMPAVSNPNANQQGYYTPGNETLGEGYGYASGEDFADLDQQTADAARVERLKGQDITNLPGYAQKRRPNQKTFNQYEDQMRATGSLQDALVNYYVSTGMPQRTASILVEAVGEMAQLQQDSPGLPIADSEPKNVNPDTAIGGKEGDKYQNWDVADKQKGLDAGHQDFTDFGEPTREFIQPGGEAPYSENTKKDIFEGAEQSKMDAKRVKQDDNAPKKSNASIKEASGYVYKVIGREVRLEDHGNFYSAHLKLKDGSEEEIGEIMIDSNEITADSGTGPGQNFSADPEGLEEAIEHLIEGSGHDHLTEYENTENAPKTSARSGLRGMFTDSQLQSLRNHYEDGEGKISPSLLEKCKRLGLCGEDGQFTDKFKQMLDQHVENSGNGPEGLKSLFAF
jgi:hypothetical protein